MIRRNRGAQGDPHVVDALCKVLGQPTTAIAGDTGPDNGNGSPVSPSLPLDARERAQRRPPGCDG